MIRRLVRGSVFSGLLAATVLAGAPASSAAPTFALPTIVAPSIAGPIQVVASERSTFGVGTAYDVTQGTRTNRDEIEGPDQGPFWAEASGGATIGGASAAGVTRHISSFGGRSLQADLHCDANASVDDTEVQSGSAQCGNHYEVTFRLQRPAKVSIAAVIDSSHTRGAGGYGEIALFDAAGTALVQLLGDFDEIYERLNLPPGDYKLLVTGTAGASTFGKETFSAVTFDQRLTLTVRNY